VVLWPRGATSQPTANASTMAAASVAAMTRGETGCQRNLRAGNAVVGDTVSRILTLTLMHPLADVPEK
jgi:hypothetical protein